MGYHWRSHSTPEWWHTPLIPVLQRQRLEDLCKLRTRLVYRPVETTERAPVSGSLFSNPWTWSVKSQVVRSIYPRLPSDPHRAHRSTCTLPHTPHRKQINVILNEKKKITATSNINNKKLLNTSPGLRNQISKPTSWLCWCDLYPTSLVSLQCHLSECLRWSPLSGTPSPRGSTAGENQ